FVERADLTLVLLDDANTHVMRGPGNRENSANRERQKPSCLIVGGCNDEVDGCTCLVPDTAVVGRSDAESVLSRRKIGVERLSAVAHIPPVAIEALELVAKSHLFGRHQAQCGVIDLQIVDTRRQAYRSTGILRRVVRLAVGDDVLNLHWR